MIRWLLMACLLVYAGACAIAVQRAFVYPTLPARGMTINRFLPAGWHLVRSARGDLNGDGRADVAGVLALNRTVQDAAVDPVNRYRPQLVCVLFAHPAGGFALAAQSADLLPFDATSVEDDGAIHLTIARGTLVARITEPHGVSWWHGRTTARFRYQARDWHLIGMTHDVYHAGSGAQKTYDYNLSTGKMQVITGNYYDKKVQAHVRWKTLGKRRVVLAQYRTWSAQWSHITDSLPMGKAH